MNTPVHKITTRILAVAIIFITATWLTRNMAEPFDGAQGLVSIVLNVCYGYIASYIFYYINIHIPEKKKRDEINNFIGLHLGRIIFNFNTVEDELKVNFSYTKNTDIIDIAETPPDKNTFHIRLASDGGILQQYHIPKLSIFLLILCISESIRSLEKLYTNMNHVQVLAIEELKYKIPEQLRSKNQIEIMSIAATQQTLIAVSTLQEIKKTLDYIIDNNSLPPEAIAVSKKIALELKSAIKS